MGHKQLNLEKREIIERLLGENYSIRKIATILGYSPSGICQEIKRNSKYIAGKLVYHSEVAQRRTIYRNQRHGAKTCIHDDVVKYVVEKLKLYWSPEQIQGRLVLKYPNDKRYRISYKTIYRWIQKARLKRSPIGTKVLYTKYLRLKRAGKRMRLNGPETRGYRHCLPSIEDRPEAISLKRDFGHWEGDMVNGYRAKENAVTMVEMSTGFLLAARCKNKKKETVAETIKEMFKGIDPKYIKTITLDRGSEFSSYEAVQSRFGCSVYFCHPQSPNERALNEQTNGLLRQFYPKRKASRFDDLGRLEWAVNLINHRPRKKFGYRTTWEIIKERDLSQVFSLV